MSLYGLWVKGKLIQIFYTKRAAMAYVGRRHLSGYIDILTEEELWSLVDSGRSSDSRNGKHGIRSQSPKRGNLQSDLDQD